MRVFCCIATNQVSLPNAYLTAGGAGGYHLGETTYQNVGKTLKNKGFCSISPFPPQPPPSPPKQFDVVHRTVGQSTRISKKSLIFRRTTSNNSHHHLPSLFSSPLTILLSPIVRCCTSNNWVELQNCFMNCSILYVPISSNQNHSSKENSFDIPSKSSSHLFKSFLYPSSPPKYSRRNSRWVTEGKFFFPM